MIEPWRLLVDSAALKHGIEQALLAAIIQTESGGDMWVTRYEPQYNYLYFARNNAENNKITVATEETLQRMSWGLTQLMGGVCRELGFEGQIPQMITPELNLDYACRFIKQKQQKYGDDPCVTYAAYNAGSIRKLPSGFYVNQKNVDRFYSIYQTMTLTFKGDKP